jgi:hypothetical protein
VIQTSRIKLVLPFILIAFIKEFLVQIEMPDSWEDLSSDGQSCGRKRYTISCTGFPISITFLSSKTNLKNAKNDLLLEILNLMPQWSADLWMDTVVVEDSPGISLAGVFSIAFSFAPILILTSSIQLLNAVGSIVPLWTQNVIDAQLHRCAIDLPGYTAMRKIAKLASRLPANKRPIEDTFMRFAFALAAYFTNIDESL